MKEVLNTKDLSLNHSKMMRKGMATIMKELEKYPYNISINILHALFLNMIHCRYTDKAERSEMMKMFEEAKNKTFSGWDEMRECKKGLQNDR